VPGPVVGTGTSLVVESEIAGSVAASLVLDSGVPVVGVGVSVAVSWPGQRPESASTAMPNIHR
jgi:hypothetical protein